MRGASPSAITMCQISRRMYNATFMTHTDRVCDIFAAVEMQRRLHDLERDTLHDLSVRSHNVQGALNCLLGRCSAYKRLAAGYRAKIVRSKSATKLRAMAIALRGVCAPKLARPRKSTSRSLANAERSRWSAAIPLRSC